MLSNRQLIVLGMMIFALFLGAGNIIFPPMEGYKAGENWLLASLGFVLTGVILPFITLVMVTIKGKGESLSSPLPTWLATTFWVILYTTIGWAFAMPRVTNAAYEMAWVPLGFGGGDYGQIIFAFIFNAIALFFLLRPTGIVSVVGKYMTPVLLILLIIVSVLVFTSPLSAINPPRDAYADRSALSAGIMSGYQTMDVLAALAFGGIIANIFRTNNIHQSKHILKYTILAGSISVTLLSLLYVSLFHLGATSHAVAHDATNGGQIFARYIDALLGSYGVWAMSLIILLANMTTLIGVNTACTDYFTRLTGRFGLKYTHWAIAFSILTTIVSFSALETLLSVTIPMLLLIYPIAITLVMLGCIQSKLSNIRLAYISTITIATLFGITGSLQHLKLMPDTLNKTLDFLPLYQDGLGFLIPTLVVMVVFVILNPTKAQSA